MTKLLWFNGQHPEARAGGAGGGVCRGVAAAGAVAEDILEDYLRAVIACMGERVRLYSELGEQAAYFSPRIMCMTKRACASVC